MFYAREIQIHKDEIYGRKHDTNDKWQQVNLKEVVEQFRKWLSTIFD